MNRECNGDFFDAMVDGKQKRFYRCFGNGLVIDRGDRNNEDECPECHRKIDGRFHGLVTTRIQTVAVFELWSGNEVTEVISSRCAAPIDTLPAELIQYGVTLVNSDRGEQVPLLRWREWSDAASFGENEVADRRVVGFRIFSEAAV